MAFASEPNTLSDHQSVVNEMLYSIAGFGSVKSSSYPSPCASNGTTYNSTSFTGGRCGSAPPLSSGPSECDNAGWVEHEGPEGTGCFRQLNNDKRKPFKWYSRKGDDLGKVIIELQGGGACYGDFTCTSPLYPPYGSILTCMTDPLPGLANLLKVSPGLHYHCNKLNPLASYSHVYVPYCTCDRHAGNNPTKRYGYFPFRQNGFHVGNINFQAVLTWMKEEMPFGKVTDIFVTGDSAGAIGSYVQVGNVIDAFPNARVVHWADSYIPVFGKEGWEEAVANWNLLESFSPKVKITQDDLTWSELGMIGILEKTANTYPQVPFASYWTADEAIQPFFFGLTTSYLGCMLAFPHMIRSIRTIPCVQKYSEDWNTTVLKYVEKVKVLQLSNYALFQGQRIDNFLTGHVISFTSDFYTQVAEEDPSMKHLDWINAVMSPSSEMNQVMYEPAVVM